MTEENKNNAKQQNETSYYNLKWKSVMLYYEYNSINIQTNSNSFSVSKIIEDAGDSKNILDDKDPSNIDDITSIIKSAKESDLSSLIAKHLGVEKFVYPTCDHSERNIISNNQHTNDELSKFCDQDWGLYSRRDRSKLTHSQIEFLWNKIHKSGSSISEISRQYKLAPSTLYRIQMLSKRSIINLPRKPYRQVAESDKIEFKEKLMEFYSSTSTPFTIPEAKEIISWVSCSKLSNSSIRKIMKTVCNLSYVFANQDQTT